MFLGRLDLFSLSFWADLYWVTSIKTFQNNKAMTCSSMLNRFFVFVL